MAKVIRKDQAGFTMIELMIVLAIAATVMTGVLVAAQALQRAGRNHQRLRMASFVLATVNEYQATTGKTATNIKPFISKLEEGLSYYNPTPGAISPYRVIRGYPAGTPYSDLEFTSLTRSQSLGATQYYGRVWKFDRSTPANGLTFTTPEPSHTNGILEHSYGNGNSNTSCSIPRTETIGFPNCFQSGRTYIGDDFATELIGIFSNTECLDRNSITFGSNVKQIAVMYKLEGSDLAQCIDI